MRRTGPVVAVALVLVVDAVVLAGVAWNRRGAPDAILTLTERELPLAYTWKENSGLWLEWQWGERSLWYDPDPDSEERPSWDTQDKLQELGFDCHVPPDDASAETFYEKARALTRYAVLEFDGDSWTRWLERQEHAIEDLERRAAQSLDEPRDVKEKMKRLKDARVSRSRLMVIDLGRDPAALRTRYPDRARYLILTAVVRLVRHQEWDQVTHEPKGASLHVVVEEPLPDEVLVPRSERPVLQAIRDDDLARSDSPRGWVRRLEEPPRYEVTLAVGRRLEPWIAGVRALKEAPAPR